jgi:glyoxylase-like metal-dependent hydrolase (beta-lactamase superfamily II)
MNGLNPAPIEPSLQLQPDLQPRQIHTITDRFSMANTYLIVAKQLIVVDPCSELNVCLLYRYLHTVLRRSPADIALVVLTNLHADQAEALAALRRQALVPVAAAAALRKLARSQRCVLDVAPRVLHSGLFPDNFERQLLFVDTWLEDAADLPFEPQWRVIACPGHSPDSLCLYNPFTCELLCGDTVLGVERHMPVLRGGSDRSQLEDLLQFLRSLRIHYLYPGHGRPILAEQPLAHISIEW